MNPWNQAEVLGLARNFMECRILLSGAELDLFTLLTPNALTAREIADRIQAGFADIRLIQSGEHMDGLMEAFRPWLSLPGQVPNSPRLRGLTASSGSSQVLSWRTNDEAAASL